MAKELAPWALWATPILITIIGVLIGMMVRYFLAHIVASMTRIEGRVELVCRDLKDNYVTRVECEAHRSGLQYRVNDLRGE